MRRSRFTSPPSHVIEHRANPRARRVSLRVDAAKHMDHVILRTLAIELQDTLGAAEHEIGRAHV